jgi:hypothetical protein
MLYVLVFAIGVDVDQFDVSHMVKGGLYGVWLKLAIGVDSCDKNGVGHLQTAFIIGRGDQKDVNLELEG